MKIGIIYCAYNTESYINASLFSWLIARETKLGENDFVINCLSVPFEKFDEPRLDNTVETLKRYLKNKKIDFLISNDLPTKETEARTIALNNLISNGVDLIWQVDSDEFYSLQEVERIIKFVSSRPHSACFYGSLKNYVFDNQTYLINPFNPMRIHRVQFGKYRLSSFWDDNNISYLNTENNEIVKDIDVSPAVIIPKAVQFTKHLTWMSDERGRKKVEYQNARGWNCSFSWNYSKNCLEWNENFFKNSGQPIPETSTD